MAGSSIFKEWDADDRPISLIEFAQALRSMGLQPAEKQMQLMFRKIDPTASGFVDRHPGVDAALRRNTARRVTAYDIHATLRHLASWPLMPQPTLEATSLFVDLEDDRPCDAARVPAEWCVERPAACGTERK